MDPRFFDLALVLLALEGAGLTAWRLWRGAGPRPVALAANLAAGACLIAAARALALGASGFWVLGALTGALLAHALDLAARWERARNT
jgi:hypothetical protein